MKSKLKTVFLIAPVVIFLDQVTKWIIVHTIPYGSQVTIWENFFDLVHARNRGAAFGFLSQWNSNNRDLFFYALSIFAIIFLFYYLKEIPAGKKSAIIPIGLILGGAVGNIADRILRGSVVDFLSFHWYNHQVFGINLIWPAFNVADSAITIGVFWLMLATARKKG